MYEIEGTSIKLVRGDSFYVRVGIEYDDADESGHGTPYELQEGDRVRFAMKKTYNDEQPLILKEIPIDTMILHLEPEDTKPHSFGKYVYDIELTTANGDVDTFIKEAKFELTKEVY